MRQESNLEFSAEDRVENIRRVMRWNGPPSRAREIREFTGIDAPNEPPEDAEIIVQTLNESVATILERLLPRLKCNSEL